MSSCSARGEGAGAVARRAAAALERSAGETLLPVLHVERAGKDVTIRLIGIDAPEVDWYGGEAECYGAQAGTFARRLLGGERVRLEYDDERIDPYGRTLAYVYLGRRMVNVTLVRRGYAVVTIYEPNDRYEERLRRVEAAARERGAGLWSAC